MAPADILTLSLLGLASLRGLFIGLTRELLSLAAIATACIVLRIGWNPLAERIVEGTGWEWLAARIAGHERVFRLTEIVTLAPDQGLDERALNLQRVADSMGVKLAAKLAEALE